MKVLLSPAKALDFDKEIASNKLTEPHFLNEASYLVNKMSKFSAGKIGKMMHLSKELADLNYDRYQNWKPEAMPNNENGASIAVFNGEAYRGFDASSLTENQLLVAQEKVRVLSGLYGILKPLDVIYPYRLEMGTKWSVTPAKKNLYQYWGKSLAEKLNEENEDGIIINVASNEYFKAIDTKVLKGRVITPVFKDLKNGEFKTIMVFAKKARGMMARFIVVNNITNPEEIKAFDTDGYRYDENMSSENEWVFTR